MIFSGLDIYFDKKIDEYIRNVKGETSIFHFLY